PVPVGHVYVVLLWASSDPQHPAVAPGAWVGLDGSGATVSDLPAPVGDPAVPVVNPLDVPLYLPRGETIVPEPGAGDPRVIDRPVWIGAASAAYVPVVQPTAIVAVPPYKASIDRVSPDTLRALRRGDWMSPLERANEALQVDAGRRHDVLAGYESVSFL